MSRFANKNLAVQAGWLAVRPWAGWVCGPAAWASHQVFGYALVPLACDTGSRWPYHVLTVTCLLLAGLGGLASWTALTRSETLAESRSIGRLRLMARIGLMLGAISVAGIGLEYTGSFFLGICTGMPLS